ncbi:MAG: RagB/SusD family nutrient uptake outer membrane protein, partial [Dysgonamonadaceae bacterium]|nr:RagB/SusD family nutrient uptake outer membrane protein [Dysgonamonadaceae bacterium]
MKKFFYTVITAATLIVAFQGCETDPIVYSDLTADKVYTEPSIVEARFLAPFNKWASLYGGVPYSGFPAVATYSSDEMLMPARGVHNDWYDGGIYMDLWKHQFNPELGTAVTGAWDAFESGVVSVWRVIDEFDQYVDFDALGYPQGTKESMYGQLNVLLAHWYLEGLNVFGGLPIYNGVIVDLKARSTDRETFEFIEGLLREALPNLPKRVKAEYNEGKITQGIAASLLARLYSNARPYIGEDRDEQCISICDSILTGKVGYYELASDYRNIFGWNNGQGNEVCDELIWAVSSVHGLAEREAGVAKYATHYNTSIYLDNASFKSWNGMCLTPSLDMTGRSYRTDPKAGLNDTVAKVGSSERRGTPAQVQGILKMGCPYAKFEANDIRKQNYLWDPKTEGSQYYRGMFLAGICTNPLIKKSITADGSREYRQGLVIPMEDRLAYLNFSKWPNPSEGAMSCEENSGVRLLKFSPIPNTADNALRFDPDVPVIRLTEIQYMLAECYFNKGDKQKAADLINAVRERYFTAASPDPNPVTAANLDDYRLLDEWLIEFIGEGRRRTDLVRRDKFTTEKWWDHPADNDP